MAAVYRLLEFYRWIRGGVEGRGARSQVKRWKYKYKMQSQHCAKQFTKHSKHNASQCTMHSKLDDCLGTFPEEIKRKLEIKKTAWKSETQMKWTSVKINGEGRWWQALKGKIRQCCVCLMHGFW